MYTRSGVKMDGDCPIRLTEVIVGDIITVEMQTATTRRGEVLFDEFTGVVYQVNPDGSAMVFNWNHEAFATIRDEKVMLTDHNTRSATKASKFRYEDNPILADQCKFGHEVMLADGSEAVLLGRTKCGSKWNAYLNSTNSHVQIPLDEQVTIVDRDVLMAKHISKWML